MGVIEQEGGGTLLTPKCNHLTIPHSYSFSRLNSTLALTLFLDEASDKWFTHEDQG